MKKIRRLVARTARYFRDEQWAVTVSIIGSLIIVVPQATELLDGQLDAGQSWPAALMVVVGFVTRSNVWSRHSATVLQDGPPASTWASNQTDENLAPSFPTLEGDS